MYLTWDWYVEYIKNFQHLTVKSNNSIRKWSKTGRDISPKWNIMRRYPTTLTIRQM